MVNEWHKLLVNTKRSRQNGRRFPEDIFECIFMNENVRISIKSSLNSVPYGLIKYTLALIQIMAWCRPGDKPLSEPIMVTLLTHICVTRPQWVNVEWMLGSQGRRIYSIIQMTWFDRWVHCNIYTKQSIICQDACIYMQTRPLNVIFLFWLALSGFLWLLKSVHIV